MTHAMRGVTLLVLATLLQFVSSARAASMTDLWWDPNESGWGVNLIEQQGTIFMTLFVYGTDGRPAWYVGPEINLTSTTSSSRVYTGALYATTGMWFGGAFNPSGVGVRQVGSVTFTATSPYAGTLAYSVDGVFVSKAIQRQFIRHINLSGTYYGALDFLAASTCGSSAIPFFVTQGITATVSASGRTGNITLTTTDVGATFTFSGSYTQYGSIFYSNGLLTFQGTSLPAVLYDFTADDDGIRGNIQADGACRLLMRFAAVRPG